MCKWNPVRFLYDTVGKVCRISTYCLWTRCVWDAEATCCMSWERTCVQVVEKACSQEVRPSNDPSQRLLRGVRWLLLEGYGQIYLPRVSDSNLFRLCAHWSCKVFGPGSACLIFTSMLSSMKAHTCQLDGEETWFVEFSQQLFVLWL